MTVIATIAVIATIGAIAMMIATVGTTAVTATILKWRINKATRMAFIPARVMGRGARTTIHNVLTFIETDMVTAAVITETTDAMVMVNSSRHIARDFCKDMIRVIEATGDHVIGVPETTAVGRFPFK